MALFDNKTKPVSQEKALTAPIVARTQFIAKELSDVATRHKIAVSELDFTITDTETFIRINQSGAEAEWGKIANYDLNHIEDTAHCLDKFFEIKQIHDIEIFLKNPNSTFQKFQTAIGTNATKCKIYLNIKQGSHLGSVAGFEDEYMEYINKAKAKAGVLIYMFDDMLRDYVSKVAAIVKVNGSLEYAKDEMVLISSSFEPTKTIDDKLVKYYEHSENMSDADRIDYSKRGFIYGAIEGELLMEYIKPQKGTAGRDCRGAFIDSAEPLVSNIPTFKCDSTIEISETAASIQYKAKTKGYVSLDSDLYSIKPDLEIKEVSFRKTGSVFTNLDSDVALNVKENDSLKDAIGSGMSVEIHEINIKGSVGSNSHVKAKMAKIEGQTHKTSTIESDELFIHIHKGMAIGENVTVDILEGGSIKAKNATIDHAAGGTILAQNIVIDLCSSNVKATASKTIEIRAIDGGDNIFTIDPTTMMSSDDDMHHDEKETADLHTQLAYLMRDIKKDEEAWKNSSVAFANLKKRLIHYKSNGVKIPDSFLSQYKEFMKMQEKLNELKGEYDAKNQRLIFLTTKNSVFQDDITKCRIINRGSWVGYNEVVFKLIRPDIRLVYKPAENSSEKVFGVVEVEDGIFEIKAVKE